MINPRTSACWLRKLSLLLALAPVAALQAQSTYATPYAITTIAGSATGGSADGTGLAAQFHFPFGVAVDASGNLYIADRFNNTIRKMTPAGVVTTLAGSASFAFGSADGTGSAARFHSPHGVALDSSGNVYVSDYDNHTIRKITPGGVVTTLAGTVSVNGSFADGTGSAALFQHPEGLAVDASNNVYVVDSWNQRIRKITPGGVVTTIAGSAVAGSADGTGAAAKFFYPVGLAIDGSGNLFVADFNKSIIRKITTPGAVVTTFAGTAGTTGSTDGTGAAALFNFPQGVATDVAGNVYVSDSSSSTIRKITPAGAVTTLAGLAPSSGTADGSGSTARFDQPYSLAVDAAGVLYIPDTVNNTIRKGVLSSGNDFSADGKSDIAWQNTSTGGRGFWLMNGVAFGSWVDFGVIPTDWRVAATADFNSDGQTDILWENTATGDRGFYLMNGTTFSSWVDMGVVSTDWRIAATGDMNGDGHPDILWENTVSGARGIYLMNGTSFVSWVDLGTIATALHIVGTGDFNGDGKADIIWENTSTGKRVIWYMNGTGFVSSYNLGIVSTDWHLAAVADFNGDGQPDILWENTVTGDRGFWLMNGTAVTSWVDLGIVTTDWRIAQ